MPVTPIRATTQEHLDIEDITNDLIILKNGSASLVLQTSSVNFGLLSEEEQDSTIYAYAALLNSLTFPIQIIVSSQKKDVTGYVALLGQQEQKQTNPLLKKFIKNYKGFVEKTVKEGNVLDKKFYIVIPFSYLELGLAAVKGGVKNQLPYPKDQIIKKALTVLKPKRDHLIRQFSRLGLKARQLKTQELIKFIYSIYNPDSSQSQQFASSSEYTRPVVAAAIQPQPNPEPNNRTAPPANPQANPINAR